MVKDEVAEQQGLALVPSRLTSTRKHNHRASLLFRGLSNLGNVSITHTDLAELVSAHLVPHRY